MRANATAEALEAAAALRGYVEALEAIATRESILPLERRRVARLADLVARQPAAFDNRRDCRH